MAIPQQLGYFKLLEEIGRGGMGSVWRALDPTLNREVAIKVLREEMARDPKFMADFLQEARNAAAISHPHIAQVYLVGDAGGQYYIVMELLRGRSLRQILEAGGALDEERALDIIIQVSDALRAAYKQQMIHGDIKPANIFITEDQGAKVLDFGLAKLANVEVTADQRGIWGSPYYISPERVGQKAEDFRSDVYSLGATLFHALTGRPPFDAEDPSELALKRLNEKPPLLRDLDPKITEKTEQVVNKMLNKSILMRYLDYEALLKDLSEAKMEATAQRLGVDLHALEHPQPLIPTIPPPPPRSKKSPIPIIIGVSIAVVAIVAAVAFVLWHSHSTPSNTAVPPGPVEPPPPKPRPKLPPPKPPPPVRSSGAAIVACWLLHGGGGDISVNGHTLSFVGDPTFAQGRSGLALSLNGVDQYAQTAGMVLDTSKPFSVTAWVTWNGGPSHSPSFISQDGMGSSVFSLGKRKNAGFCFALKRTFLQTAEVESTTALLRNTWYHVVGVFTGTSIKLYVDGKLAATESISSPYFTAGPMIVGADLLNDKRSDYWGGMINEVKVFNRALSDAEVEEMAAVLPPAVSNPSPGTAAPSTVVTSKVTTVLSTNATSPGTGAKTPPSSNAEAKLVRSVVALVTNLWFTCDFQTALAKCNDLDQQLTTPEGKQALQTPLAVAKRLADFKTQLTADFQRQRYYGGNLTNRNGVATMSSGMVTDATDTELIASAAYGELREQWADIKPESLVRAAEFYADATASKEPTEKRAKRHFQLMVFCKQFQLDCLARQHSIEANRLDPSLNAETTLIWGRIPLACSQSAWSRPPPASRRPRPRPNPRR
jgi:serine/threonine protein kinase